MVCGGLGAVESREDGAAIHVGLTNATSETGPLVSHFLKHCVHFSVIILASQISLTH